MFLGSSAFDDEDVNPYFTDSGYAKVTDCGKGVYRFELEMTQENSEWWDGKKVHVSVFYEGKFTVEEAPSEE